MVTHSVTDPSFGNRQIKLDTLVRLRWLAILGQGAAVLFVWLGLSYSFPAILCLALVGLSAWLNLYLQMQFRKDFRLKALPATALLAYDSCQLAALLYLTGGLHNPFAVLLIVPPVISATTQHVRFTSFLAVMNIAFATTLIWFHLPLPWASGAPINLPVVYVFGVWASIVLAMIFMSIYAFRIAQEGRMLADALSATELVLAKEQHLSNLDGLATAAAHELGTPLATITLTSKELERELFDDDPLKEDVSLIRSQAERCREILGKIRSLSSSDDTNFTKHALSTLIEEIVEPHRNFGIEIKSIFSKECGEEPILLRNPGITYGLGNLVENAVDFAKSEVEIHASWTEDLLSLRIMDDGPGFSDHIRARLGDPYVTSRDLKQRLASETGESDTGADDLDGIGGGLGLGFFIAKTLLERSGATVTVSNRQVKLTDPKQSDSAKTGAVIHIYWPRAQLETDQYKRSKFDARLIPETD